MISLLVPFSSQDEHRRQIFDWVIGRWARLHPDFQLCIGRNNDDTFNRSAARNRAFEQSFGDILVISDADTVCHRLNVIEAIFMVEHGAPWIVAHDEYFSLTKEYTRELMKQRPDTQLKRPFISDWKMKEKSMAGVLVMRRDAWVGYDERFQDWGFEDNEFAVRMDRTAGPHQRVKGPMLHLWHPRGLDFEQPLIEHNRRLYEETRDEAL